VRNRITELMIEKMAREGRIITQSEVAQELGITKQGFSKIVRNEINSYSVELLDRICEYFDCEVGDVLRRTSEEVLAPA